VLVLCEEKKYKLVYGYSKFVQGNLVSDFSTIQWQKLGQLNWILNILNLIISDFRV